MPCPALSLGALVSQNDFITSSASRLEDLSVMTTAKQLAILMEINQIDEQLLADAAGEARRMPTHRVDSCRINAHRFGLNRRFTLEMIEKRKIIL